VFAAKFGAASVRRVLAGVSLDVVIVAYRSREMVRDCLLSIQAFPPDAPMTIFVVDNDSRDGTLELVQRDFADVQAIANDVNAGFSIANNQAIRAGASEYVLALNPDTRVRAGALQQMIELMETHREVAIAGCRLELEDGSFDHAAKRSFPTPTSALAHFIGLGNRFRESARLAAYQAPHVRSGPVDAVNGAFMLMRREALNQVGLFDEGYWMYMEDLDLCYRAKRAGWVTWYEPDVTITHIKAGTSGKLRGPKLNYAFHYGMFRFYRKFYAPQRHSLVNLAVYLGIGGKLAVSLARTAVLRTYRPEA
jgi:N-acetylglucosaminyl-diphospho-decaprenol L-rhamnosyltransferase